MAITTDYILTTKHYVGIACVLLSVVLYFTNRKLYFLFFALTLTVGLIGFLDFNITTFKIGFAGIGINPIFLGLMILFFALSKVQMDKIAPEKNGPKKRKSYGAIGYYNLGKIFKILYLALSFQSINLIQFIAKK